MGHRHFRHGLSGNYLVKETNTIKITLADKRIALAPAEYWCAERTVQERLIPA